MVAVHAQRLYVIPVQKQRLARALEPRRLLQVLSVKDDVLINEMGRIAGTMHLQDLKELLAHAPVDFSNGVFASPFVEAVRFLTLSYMVMHWIRAGGWRQGWP